MTEERLTTRERAALLVLMAEARELTNAELRELAGFTVDGECRKKLNGLGLVTSEKVGRAFVHVLTDEGGLRCQAELTAPLPPRAGYLGGALHAVMAGLHRHFELTGTSLSDIFVLDPEHRIETAYLVLAVEPGEAVALRVLRERLDDLSRPVVDRALTSLADRQDVHLRAEADQKSLTDEDRDAALVLGGTPRHTLMIEAVR